VCVCMIVCGHVYYVRVYVCDVYTCSLAYACVHACVHMHARAHLCTCLYVRDMHRGHV
jgi:hypothetical protein